MSAAGPSQPTRARGGEAARVGAHVRRFALLLLVVAIALSPMLLLAAEAVPTEKDPIAAARAVALGEKLRCLVCQNQSIDDSNAALARDLRLLVRERLQAGDSDAAVLAFVEARYGEFVLLRPKLNAHTLLLWLAPLILLVASTLLLLRRGRRGAAGADNEAAPLTSAEHERLEALIGRKLPKP
jgi:cytochrome c-type biogenesis protein CcmH